MEIIKKDGGGGIRTHDTFSRIHAFQAGSLSHSDTPPKKQCYQCYTKYTYSNQKNLFLTSHRHLTAENGT